MAAMPPIKKNDEVFILRGKDRGKTGRVLIVMPKDDKIVVEGIQMIKRHTRPNPQRNIKGGIVEKEAPIHGVRVLGDGNVDRALHVSAHYFTESAKEKITKAGGTVEVISL